MLLQEKLKNKNIILASQSPRRKELLAGLDLPFTAISLNVDESYPQSLAHKKITEYLCRKKAKAYQNIQPNDILITSDTIVWLDGKALEKPENEQNAVDMLVQLSGKTHEVITSVGLFSTEKESVFTDTTKVTFSHLTNEEIAYYVSKYQPFDKAGGYGVQEWIGYVAVSNLNGSYFTVMGFPVHKVYQELMNF